MSAKSFTIVETSRIQKALDNYYAEATKASLTVANAIQEYYETREYSWWERLWGVHKLSARDLVKHDKSQFVCIADFLHTKKLISDQTWLMENPYASHKDSAKILEPLSRSGVNSHMLTSSLVRFVTEYES